MVISAEASAVEWKKGRTSSYRYQREVILMKLGIVLSTNDPEEI